jgi:eukaryotic-like serine/threonine-protein kinase
VSSSTPSGPVRGRDDSPGTRPPRSLSTLGPPEPPPPVNVGDAGALRSRDRYEGAQPLGTGGMGEVLLCHDTVLGRRVALKRTKANLEERSSVRARFLREARVQAQLEHPTVVPVYDLGVDTDGRPYFTMRRVTGDSLDDILWGLDVGAPGASVRFSQRRLLGIFRQICLGVEYAHRRGVVHRDLKPANVMVGHWGEVYLLDWGLAKLMGDRRRQAEGTNDEQTRRGEILGTPGYMAPEQALSASEVDARADVYALGAILFELLTWMPLHSGTRTEILRSTHSGRDVRPSEVAPERDIPPELDAIVHRATAVLPEDRTASAGALAEAIDRHLEGERDSAQRRRMAERYVRAAKQAASIEDAAHREVALRDARKAIALDPTCETATQLLLSLAIEPHAGTPNELMGAEAEELKANTRSLARFGVAVYGTFFAGVAALTIAAGPTLPGVVSATSLGLATLVSARGAFAKVRSYELNFVLLSALVSLSIASAAPFIGVLSLLPQLSIAHALSLTFRPIGRARYAHLGLALASFVVPFVLDWAGVIGPYDTVQGGVIESRLAIAVLPPGSLPYLALSLTIAVLAAAAIALRRLSVTAARRERELYLRLWHLEKLVPGSLHPRKDPSGDSALDGGRGQ